MRKKGGELESEALRPTLFVPMTGEAEEKREVKPDPTNPQIVNGSFEQITRNDDGSQEPAGWHYQRQLTLQSAAQGADAQSAPDGERFVTFENREAGRGCQALQGFAVDGREVARLELTFQVRGEDIQPGQSPNQLPAVVITFYDEKRTAVGEASTDPFSGSFDWRAETKTLRVPLRAREAVLRVGLLGATGRLSLDGLSLKAAP
jgi:protein-L-isoaspartate(D-aspartate) O-methyltransferase